MAVLFKAGSNSDPNKRKKKNKSTFAKLGIVGTKKKRGKSKKELEHEEFLKAQKKKERRLKAMSKDPASQAKVKISDTVLDNIRSAAHQGKLLEIMYKDLRSKKSRRTVEPYSLKYDSKGLKMYAYCQIRKGIRAFFIKRILESYILAQMYVPQFDVTIEKDFEGIKKGNAKA